MQASASFEPRLAQSDFCWSVSVTSSAAALTMSEVPEDNISQLAKVTQPLCCGTLSLDTKEVTPHPDLLLRPVLHLDRRLASCPADAS